MVNVMSASQIRIVDITKEVKYEKYLYRCLAGPPSKRYKKRIKYLEKAIPKGFHKKLLIANEKVVGTIEYAPSEASYYPIVGDNVTVMNCIWVLRKAKGHDYGRLLVRNMINSEKDSSGFATIALENHWSPWFKRWQMETLGFKPLESIKVMHKSKYEGQIFSIYLMWMPNISKSKPPTWNIHELLEGITCCIAHPLYHPQTFEPKQILEKHEN